MSEAAALQTLTTKSSHTGLTGLVLQRKCACGGSSGLTGSCAECENKKLRGKPLRAKLRINEPGDAYEQEADRVAQQVMRMPNTARETNSRKPSTGLVQRKVGDSDVGIDAAPAIVHDVLAAPGDPLDATTRAFFEPRFGHDFSAVRIHTDSKAAASARSVNALAYTAENHIVFGTGRPDTSAFHKELLAHELAHVVQQSPSKPSAMLQRRDLSTSQVAVGSKREGGEAAELSEGRKPARRVSIPWQGSLHASLRALARPYTVSEADADSAASAMIQAVGAQWQIEVAGGVRSGLDEAAMDAAMTPNDTFFLGEGPFLDFFARQLGVSQEQLLATDQDQISGKAIEAEWPLLEDPALAEALLDLLDHFTDVRPQLVDIDDGLDEQEIWSLVEQDSRVETLTGLFTHHYVDFSTNIGLGLDRFLLLEEVIFQQYLWGNINALRNLLTPGTGRAEEGETDRYGIIHRESGQLLYDESGVPLWTTVGTLLRDSGHRASKPIFGTGAGAQLDPATQMLFGVLARNLGDPLVVGAQAAKLWLENPELRKVLGRQVVALVGPQLARGIPSAIAMFAVFAGLHFLAQHLIRTGHPAAVAAGIALQAALKGVEFFMDVDFGATVAASLMRAGEHLVRVQFQEDGRLDALSKRHIDEAAIPIAEILVELIMEFGSRKIGAMFGRAAAGESKLHIDGDPAQVSETGTRDDSAAEGAKGRTSEEGALSEQETEAQEARRDETPAPSKGRALEQPIAEFIFEGESHVVKMVKKGAEFVCTMCSNGCGKLLDAIDRLLQPGHSLSDDAVAQLQYLRALVAGANSTWHTDTLANRQQIGTRLENHIEQLLHQHTSIVEQLLAALRAVMRLTEPGGYGVDTPSGRAQTPKGEVIQFGDPRKVPGDPTRGKHTRVAKATVADLRRAVDPRTAVDTLDPDLQRLREEIAPQSVNGRRSDNPRRAVYGGQLSAEGLARYDDLVKLALSKTPGGGGYYRAVADVEIGIDIRGSITRAFFLQVQGGTDRYHIVPGTPLDLPR
jgi:hypothetical protein